MKENNVDQNKTENFELSNNSSEKCKSPADFEAAIIATGFGKFNIFLLLLAIPASWATIFESTTMSYVFPAAQCDLDLGLDDKGLLNAITYGGMITSACIWGFLFDTFGRKKLLIFGFLIDALIVVIGSLSQNKIMLMISKFFGGLIINGPYAATTAYISEFHRSRHRPKLQLLLGIFNCLGNIFLPLFAWAMLPTKINFSIFDEWLVIRPWNIYLLVNGVPALISGLAFILVPESPKFLMSSGNNKKALEIFRKVYSINTGNPPEMYPVTVLLDEIKSQKNHNSEIKLKQCIEDGKMENSKSLANMFRKGFKQLAPLFHNPFLQNFLLICTIQGFFTMSQNTLRLWMPQMFQAINDYKYSNNGSSADLCTMLDILKPSNNSQNCFVNFNNSRVYINSIIVASVSVVGYLIAGSLINAVGKKLLLGILGIIGGISAIGLYFAPNGDLAIPLVATNLALGSIATNVMLVVTIDIFPTTLRTMAISLVMMFARITSMIGNIAFPFLLLTGCAPPFFTIGFLLITCGIFSTFLPNTENRALV